MVFSRDVGTRTTSGRCWSTGLSPAWCSGTLPGKKTINGNQKRLRKNYLIKRFNEWFCRDEPKEKRKRNEAREAGSLDEPVIKCEVCQEAFGQKKNLNAHIRNKHTAVEGGVKCPRDFCKESFNTRHEMQQHRDVCQLKCPFCKKEFTRNERFESHVRSCPRKGGPTTL